MYPPSKEQRADEGYGPVEHRLFVAQHLVENAESGLRFALFEQRRGEGEADEDSRGRRIDGGARKARRSLPQGLDQGSGQGFGGDVQRERTSEGSSEAREIAGDG